ncbi:MAG: glycosyltransferase family 4 protein [Wenzhouxiangellaceae bacterium]|nr:glycosyltransferase family 4 protein [Wenzhouxiangellaceae bacterium]
MFSNWLIVVLAFPATVALTMLVRRYSLHAGLIDQPGERRSHDRPVARGGGLAIAMTLLLAWPFLQLSSPLLAAFLIGVVVTAAMGFVDDHRPLPVRWRLPFQALLAVVTVLCVGPVDAIGVAGTSVSLVWLWTPMAIVALVWMMNLFNFMDGSDGLAATQAIFSSALFAAAFFYAGENELGWLAVLCVSACAGFLVWNWPRALVFLGDAGSLLLGWILGFLALAGTLTESVSVWLSFIIVSPFVVDATATLLWRLGRRQQWYNPHRDHAYQCLIRSGWSHQRVLLGLIAINSLLVLPGVALIIWQAWTDILVAMVLVIAQVGVWRLTRFVETKEHESG